MLGHEMQPQLSLPKSARGVEFCPCPPISLQFAFGFPLCCSPKAAWQDVGTAQGSLLIFGWGTHPRREH